MKKLILRSHLFWKFFLSIMLVVVITAVLSVQFENYVKGCYSPERINRLVTELVDFRNQLGTYIQEGASDEIELLFEENPERKLQFLVHDSYDNEFFKRNALHNETLNHPFEHHLSDAFEARGLLLDSSVKNPVGEIYYIKIVPKMIFGAIFSPSHTGEILRFLLLVSLSAITCFWLTHKLTQRIHLLQNATHRLANEDFSNDDDLRSFGNDELGQLGKDFYALVNQLAESETARRQVLSDISHELRSPLARMQVAIEIARMRQKAIPAKEVTRQLDRMEIESGRMNDLIGQIIHIQTLTLNKKDNATSPFNIIDLLKDIIEDVNYEYQQEQKRAYLYRKNSELILLGDAELWQSALENIIRNAMSHTRKDTVVIVKVEQETDAIRLCICDCGDGIEAGQNKIIFNPFTRLDTSRNRETGGYGLGLAIAKAVVERHDGHISANNRSKTKGLSICIVLPT